MHIHVDESELMELSQKSLTGILFVLGSYEYLERLEGKIRKCLFFILKYSKITVCAASIA